MPIPCFLYKIPSSTRRLMPFCRGGGLMLAPGPVQLVLGHPPCSSSTPRRMSSLQHRRNLQVNGRCVVEVPGQTPRLLSLVKRFITCVTNYRANSVLCQGFAKIFCGQKAAFRFPKDRLFQMVFMVRHLPRIQRASSSTARCFVRGEGQPQAHPAPCPGARPSSQPRPTATAHWHTMPSTTGKRTSPRPAGAAP